MLIDLGLAGACRVTVITNRRAANALSCALPPDCWRYGGATRGQASVCFAIDQRTPAVHSPQHVGLRVAARAIQSVCCVVQWNACRISETDAASVKLRPGDAPGRVWNHHVGSSLVQSAMHRR
ncbi:hypothetical protein [Xanthomonas campestris]|uniref:hypothetical protein n=1 Tax=Xanthomonas campestris TaxID=339 RepID=UPI0023E8FFC0|nr:hypothetical protein [Xanthomonas campestris]